MISKVEQSKLKNLEPILLNCKYDRVIIDSVLEGNFGVAYVNSLGKIEIIRLDSGAFTILAGNPNSDYLNEMLEKAPIYYITPQNNEWKDK